MPRRNRALGIATIAERNAATEAHMVSKLNRASRTFGTVTPREGVHPRTGRRGPSSSPGSRPIIIPGHPICSGWFGPHSPKKRGHDPETRNGIIPGRPSDRQNDAFEESAGRNKKKL
jgi:hypothetical protein